jgi:hypothetical protein
MFLKLSTPAMRLTYLLPFVRTIMLAGHETTSNTLSWALFELTRHPDIQDKLRAEIREKITEKGSNVFNERDFESMPYLTAVVKVSWTFHLLPCLPVTRRVSFFPFTLQETLRLWPVAHILYRQAAVNDVLPLSKPITLTNGKVVNELPIPKGQKIVASVIGYQRLESDFCSPSVSFVQVYVLTIVVLGMKRYSDPNLTFSDRKDGSQERRRASTLAFSPICEPHLARPDAGKPYNLISYFLKDELQRRF